MPLLSSCWLPEILGDRKLSPISAFIFISLSPWEKESHFSHIMTPNTGFRAHAKSSMASPRDPELDLQRPYFQRSHSQVLWGGGLEYLLGATIEPTISLLFDSSRGRVAHCIIALTILSSNCLLANMFVLIDLSFSSKYVFHLSVSSSKRSSYIIHTQSFPIE